MRDTIQKAIIGIAGPTVGITISLSMVEVWLRILSLLGGFLVSVLMAVSIGLSIRRKWRERNEHIARIVKRHKKHLIDPEDEPTTTSI